MRSLLLTLCALAIVLTGTAPASAADEIGLSLDGVHWGDEIDTPLLDEDATWVPGDAHTVSFFVKNRATTGAVLSISLESADGDDLWAGQHLVLRARAGGGWFTLRNGEPSPGLTAASIGSDDHVRVDLTAAFDPSSTNASQQSTLDLMVQVRLAEAVAVPEDEEPVPGEGGPTAPTPGGNDPAPDDASDPGERDTGDGANDHTGRDRAGWLARTGFDTPTMFLWLAGLAIVVGGASVAAGRQRRESTHV